MTTILSSGFGRLALGIFVILHGLVHLWFVVLSQELVAFQPEMGWTGESWLFTGLLGGPMPRTLTTVLYVLATLAFITAGIATFTGGAWTRPVLIGASIFSAALLVVYWDGKPTMIVEKGLVGLAINVALLVVSL